MGKPDQSFLLRMPMPDGRLVTVKFEFEIASSTRSKDGQQTFHVIHWGTSSCPIEEIVTTVLAEGPYAKGCDTTFDVISGPELPIDAVNAVEGVLTWSRS